MKVYEKTRTTKYFDYVVPSKTSFKKTRFSNYYEFDNNDFSDDFLEIYDGGIVKDKKTKSSELSEKKDLNRNSISTERANEYQEKVIQEQYEHRSIEHIQKKIVKKKYNDKQTDKKRVNSYNKTNGSSAVNSNKVNSKSKTVKKTSANRVNANTGTKVLGKIAVWQSAVNLGKAFLPEALKARNYTYQKNQQRIKYLTDGAEGDLEMDAGKKTGTIFTRLFDRIREIHLNLSVIIGHFNIYAGLAFFFIPIFVVLVGFIIFGAELGIHLPYWAYSNQYTVRQLMTQYDYYWECVSIETASSVEEKYGNNKTVAVPIYYNLGADSEDEVIQVASAENFINWREVLAVYYAYYSKESELPSTELKPLTDDVIESLFSAENNSKFNEIFWTMNCIMPAGNELTYKADELAQYTDSSREGVNINLCYHPSLSVVEDRLGFDFYQKDMVTKYLSPEYDDYFNPLIEHRHVSSSQYVVETALAELDNTGEKYAPNGENWCCLFVDWVLHQTGNDSLRSHPSGCTQAIHGGGGYEGWENSPDIAYVYYLADSKPQSINPQPGWIVFFNTSGDTDKLEHVGIVESYDPVSNMLITVEGNTYHQQGEAFRVCEMHRTNWDTVYCFVELKYPTDNLDPAANYPDDYAARLEYGDSYEDICNVAMGIIKDNPAIERVLLECSVLVANRGTAEWSVNESQTYQLTSGVAYITKHAADNSFPKKFNDWECDTGIYAFTDYFTKYCAYFVNRTSS